MSLSDEQWEFLQDVSLLLQYCQRIGVKVTGGELYRTEEQQDLHLESGATTVQYSRHQDRLAIDLNFFVDGEYIAEKEDTQEIGDFWESIREENVWGGNWTEFVDTPHFERR